MIQKKKEWKGKMMKSIRFTYRVQKSDHDGYCTDEENEYSSETETMELPFLEEKANEILKQNIVELQEYSTLIPVDVSCGDSRYCYVSKESFDHGLDIHDCRVSILRAD